ncbi:MAG: Rap1a/Tai family immunity protein [Candidatus Sulfotelmatobacter sp.]|jgi:Ssp1 endopeptidase immunity protein Rap1a
MKRSVLALFALFAFSGIAQQGVSIKTGFLTAEEFTRMNDQGRHDYAMGVVDGMLLAPLFGAPRASNDWQKIGPFGDCITGMSSTQVAAIVSKFVQDHPERWNESMHAVVFTAMTQACSQK